MGWDPSFAVVDELHVVSAELWNAMTLAAGKREKSLVLAISTPSDDYVDHGLQCKEPGRLCRPRS